MRGDIGRIRNAVQRMQQWLDELLELSRVGRVVKAWEDVPLAELAREAVRLVAGRIAQRGVVVDVSPELPTLFGDRRRLLEALQNLVDNAVKFMGDQPAPRVEIGVRAACGGAKETVCYVRDNGMGIDPRYHEKVFGLFEKLDPQSEGTGVGLTIVKRIIELHGGRIWIESEGPGRGSSFLFVLSQKGRTSGHG
jgi:signal transduction histidine kinase